MTDSTSLAVSPTSSTPRYQQVSAEILALINSDDYPIGSTLPTEAELCKIFKVSRFTVRKALRTLADQNIIERKRGAGTKVIADGPKDEFVYKLSAVSDLIRYPEDTYRVDLFNHLISADQSLSGKINCPIGTNWFCISGVRISDTSASPILWSDIYVLPELSEFVSKKGISRARVYNEIEQSTGTAVHEVQIKIFASSINGELAAALEVADETPGLTIVRKYLDENGCNFETSVSIHPEKRFQFSMNLHRGSFKTNVLPKKG